jgi:hypothetical protein
MRRCFQCGQRTDAAQLTAVGDGEFCPACFQQLLGASAASPGAAAPPTSAARPARAERPVTPPASASRACLVCERRIAGDAAVSFLGGDICAACNAQMERELREGEARQPAAAEATPDARPAPGAAGEARASAAAAGGDPPAAFTPGAETRWCAGCERPMPGPGSYRVIGGEPYCPACVPFYSVLNLGAHPRRPAAPPAPAPDAARGGCDCCGATLELGGEACEGFRLCTACFTSDLELALGVARARHRRKLEALRAAIATGKSS